MRFASIIWFSVLAIVLGFSMPAHAASKQELEKRMEARYPDLLKARQAGTIGESADGYVAVREAGDEKVQKLVDDENADRKEVYGLIAKETQTTVEKVAERAGKRNAEQGKSGEYLKDEKGKWNKKP